MQSTTKAREAMQQAEKEDSLNRIEAVLSKLLHQVHKVALDELDLVRKTRLGRVLARATNLELVVVASNDVDVRKPSDLTSGTTNTASDVEDSHLGLELHRVGEVVLVAGDGLVEGLALVVASKVERRSPVAKVVIRSRSDA